MSSLRRLPPTALAHRAPSPRQMLQWLDLHPRTRNCLLRYLAQEPPSARADGGKEWTLERLLKIPGFGVRALRDSVAAARALASGASAAAQQRRRLEDEIAPLLSARPLLAPEIATPLLERAVIRVTSLAPATEAEVLARLSAEDLTRGELTLGALERAARFLPNGVGFAVLRRERFALVVAAPDLLLARRIYTAAARGVGLWGVFSVGLCEGQVDTNRSELVRAVLNARVDLRWLDESLGWFWFGPRPSRLLDGIEKVLAVTSPLRLAVLSEVVLRHRPPELVPPLSALRALCEQEPRLRLADETVWLREPKPEVLSPGERAAVELLRRRGPRVPEGVLRELAGTLGIGVEALLRTVRASLLFWEGPRGVFQLAAV